MMNSGEKALTMIKNKYNWHQKQIAVNKTMKRCLTVLGITLIATALIVSCSLALAASYAQPTKVAGSETQFKFDVAYAYVGKFTGNTSYGDSNGLMSLVSQYPSTVIFNITRVPGVQIASCDAVIEVYGVHITTDNGEKENFVYIVGTNYSSSFSPDSELPSFVKHIDDIIDKSGYSGVKGDFNFNWTDNTSILSHKVGSAGLYSSLNSTLGLWHAGKPNDISVTVNRIGYVTTSNGAVSVYKDTATTKTATAVQLSNYEDGFLRNTLVPATKLPQTNLFEPTPTNQRIPSR
jgi:hypothetical protein